MKQGVCLTLINKYSSVPIYSQLKNIIIEKIEKGEYERDSKIPSEQEFCEMYGISRPTVRQAISELTNSGYLYKIKGKGTFVAAHKLKFDIRNYTGFTGSILDNDNPGELNIIKINKIKVTDFERLKEVFELSSVPSHGYLFAEIIYVYSQKDDVLSLNTSYIPLSLFPNIIEDVYDRKPAHEIFKGKYPLLPVKSKSSLEITYTDQSDAQFLKIQQGQVLVKIENLLFSKSGQAVEYVVSKYRADRCRFTFENLK